MGSDAPDGKPAGRASLNRASAVPSSRISRLARLGTLATGMAAGMVAEGFRQMAKGRRPRVSDLLLTPANVRRLGSQLAQMRGAAMKVGQLLSMDAGELLPREFSDLLASLRADARAMPRRQLVGVLGAGWGKGWQDRFDRFDYEPVASASIGQVHAAWTRDGRRLAVKVQYPGVRRSISSDVDNVATLLRITGLLPAALDIGPILEEAKRQLHEEADYVREGEQLARFGRLLAREKELLLPEVYPDLTTKGILAMSFVDSVPLESLQSAPQGERDRLVALLLALMFREIFDFRLVQTDPNFANYRYDPASRRLVLLDFGATRAYPKARVEAYRRLLTGGQRRERRLVTEAAGEIGYFGESMDARQRQAVAELVIQACEPLRHAGAYDFGASDLPARMRDAGLEMSAEKAFWHSPPADVLFLHRKIGGMFLLAARLRARVDIRSLFAPHAGTAPGFPESRRR